MKIKKLFYTIIFALILFSCKSRSITYNHTRIVKLQESGYSVFFDTLKINFKNFYSSKEQVNRITKNKKNKTINIKSNGNSNIIESENLKNKTIKNLSIPEFGLLIIDGYPVSSENLKTNVLIDLNSIKNIKILSKNDYQDKFPHLDLKGGIVILQTR